MIPTSFLPDHMRQRVEGGQVTASVRALESLLETDREEFIVPWPDYIIAAFNDSSKVNFVLVEAYQVMTRSFLRRC